MVFSTWTAPTGGIGRVQTAYEISNTNELTFSQYGSIDIDLDIQWYVIEFPSNLAPSIQRASYDWDPTT